MINGSLPTWEQILTLNFNNMTRTKTATAQKPSKLLIGFAVLIGTIGVTLLIAVITGTFLNI